MNWVRTIVKTLQNAIWAQMAKRSPSENAFLFLIPVVGAVTGLAALGIAHLIAVLQEAFWGSAENLLGAAESTPWYLRLAVPIIGGLTLGVLSWVLRTETRGSGTAGAIQALALKGGVVSFGKEMPSVLSGILTVGCGGSLGREGPMIQFGVAVGSRLGQQFKLNTQQLRILVCCAAASAIAAVYNAPIGGTIFVMEILIGNFALEIFGPVVIASVISTLIFRSAMGDLPRFVIPTYELVSGWELFGYLVLGVLAGAFSVLMIKMIFWTEDIFKKLPVPQRLKPAIGFGLVGMIGLAFPHVFGNGYEAVNLTLHEQLPLTLLLILPLAKLVATALTRGSGGAGGLFTPTLMLGALLGGGFGYVVHEWFPHSTAEHGAYALVGMGAVLAGTTHAPITAIMMIFEQTNSYPIILPLMFVCIISNFTARLLKRESIHMESLRRRGVVLPSGPEASVMQNLRVSDLMHHDVEFVRANDPFPRVVEHFLQSSYNNLYVVDGQNRFLGAIPLHALKEMLNQKEGLDMVIAQDLVDESFDFVTPEIRLADTMDKFWRRQCERMPVLDSPDTRKLIGWISKRDLIGVYTQEILQKRTLMSKFTLSEEGERGVYVELPKDFQLQRITVPASFVGLTVGEVAPGSKYAIQLLQVRHRDPATGVSFVEQPQANSRFQAGDQLVVVGTSEAIKKFEAGSPG